MIRAYTNKDLPKVMELFRKNTPEYFDTSEEIDLKNYLENELEDYFVYQVNSMITGAGGINYSLEQKSAYISWDMIHPDFHGKGIGTELIQHRITLLRKNQNIESIVVRTSQLAFRFYEKMGFTLETVKKDFWAQGFDLYHMKMKNKKVTS